MVIFHKHQINLFLVFISSFFDSRKPSILIYFQKFSHSFWCFKFVSILTYCLSFGWILMNLSTKNALRNVNWFFFWNSTFDFPQKKRICKKNLTKFLKITFFELRLVVTSRTLILSQEKFLYVAFRITQIFS